MRHLSLFKANSEILSNTYRALRNYFDKSGDIESAKTYAFLTIIANIQFPVKNLKDIARDITDLAGIYSRSHNIDAARKYSDFAIELSKKAGNPYGEALRILDKAQCLIDNNLSNEALELSKKMFDLADTTSILGGDIITEYSSGLLSEIYGKLDSMRLANYYSSIYTSKRANLLKEYDLMSETDANYTEDKDATNIDHLNIELTEVNKHLAASMIKALELRKEIQLLNTQKEGLQTAAALIRNKNDSLLSQQKALNTTNSSLSKHNDTLTKENVRLDEDNALKKKRLRATFWWAAIILGSMLIITIIVTRIQRQRILTRDLKIEQERKKIIDTRAELSSLAKGKLHNVRGDYNSFIALILKSDFSTATLYAEKCAALFSLALDKWDWEKNAYTLADELATLNAFCETQKVLGKKIIIEPSFASDLNSDQILFMPEVFTTLLHNSIKHGLRDNDAALKFNIGVTRKDDFLFFEVSDNGIPSKIESYLKPEKPNKGLALLRRRIENILEGKKDQKKFEHKFEISINLGTTIKFIFPYESTIKNNNS
jgi:hypothetical protein